MKHLRLFQTEAAFEAAKETLEKPWVALANDLKKVHFTISIEPSIPNNEIHYTTTDGNVFNMPDLSEMGLSYEYTLLSNTYENGKGVMVFDQTVENVGTAGEMQPKLYPLFADIMGEGNNTLLSIELPNSVTSIGEYAFTHCSSLTNVTIPSSVTSISYNAFQFCSGLTSVTIPNSVTSIHCYVFNGCSGLISMFVDSNNTVYNDGNGSNCIIETESNTLIVGCQNTIIPNSITTIGDLAFSYCSSLTSITIPNSITTIGDSAFSYCSGLTSVTYNGTIEQWNAITKGDNWKLDVPSTCLVHCTDGDIAI